MVEYTIDDIKGRHVIGQNGTRLGEVEDVLFDPEAWNVTGIVVAVRKEVAEDLHIERPTFGHARLNIGRERVAALGENVMLNVDADDIAALLRETRRP